LPRVNRVPYSMADNPPESRGFFSGWSNLDRNRIER
jgi:hypothetical protein